MPRYCVDVHSNVRHRFIIEADSEMDAQQKARAEVTNSSDADLAMSLKDWEIDFAEAELIEE